MAKAAFGEFTAFTNKNSVRYQRNNKLVSQSVVPPEVVAYLNKQLGYEPKETPTAQPVQRFAPPSEEEKARLKAESLQVPEHLQAEDFDLPTDSNGEAPLPRTDAPAGLHPQPAVDPDFLESVSIHTASLQDIAQALYERFGLYSVYLGQLPAGDEINPLTGENFTKYHLGIAYQAAIRAQNQGILDRIPEEGRKAIDAGRAASQNIEQSFAPVPGNMAQARRMDSFEYRTSPEGTRTVPASELVHEKNQDGSVRLVRRDIQPGETGEFNGAAARYDEDEDEPIVEPRFGKQVIRPDW